MNDNSNTVTCITVGQKDYASVTIRYTACCPGIQDLSPETRQKLSPAEETLIYIYIYIYISIYIYIYMYLCVYIYIYIYIYIHMPAHPCVCLDIELDDYYYY